MLQPSLLRTASTWFRKRQVNGFAVFFAVSFATALRPAAVIAIWAAPSPFGSATPLVETAATLGFELTYFALLVRSTTVPSFRTPVTWSWARERGPSSTPAAGETVSETTGGAGGALAARAAPRGAAAAGTA